MVRTIHAVTLRHNNGPYECGNKFQYDHEQGNIPSRAQHDPYNKCYKRADTTRADPSGTTTGHYQKQVKLCPFSNLEQNVGKCCQNLPRTTVTTTTKGGGAPRPPLAMDDQRWYPSTHCDNIQHDPYNRGYEIMSGHYQRADPNGPTQSNKFQHDPYNNFPPPPCPRRQSPRQTSRGSVLSTQ
eukprot:gene15660-biopygen6688